MSDLPAPRAARLPRPRWRDARLLAGLLLVLVSVVLGATVVARADDRVRVWALTRDLGAGSAPTTGDVRAVAVRLDEAAARYVSTDEDLSGLVLRRPVGRGELLPVAALRRADEVEARRVVLEVDRVGVSGLAKGQVVDVYVVREDTGPEADASTEPELVLAGVTVAEDVRGSGSGFGGSGATVGVSLLVDEGDVAGVIDAVAHGTVYLVMVPS